MKTLIIGTLIAILASTSVLAVETLGQPPPMHNPYLPFSNNFVDPDKDYYPNIPNPTNSIGQTVVVPMARSNAIYGGIDSDSNAQVVEPGS